MARGLETPPRRHDDGLARRWHERGVEKCARELGRLRLGTRDHRRRQEQQTNRDSANREKNERAANARSRVHRSSSPCGVPDVSRGREVCPPSVARPSDACGPSHDGGVPLPGRVFSSGRLRDCTGGAKERSRRVRRIKIWKSQELERLCGNPIGVSMLNGYVTQSVTFHSNVRFLISLLRASSRKSRRC